MPPEASCLGHRSSEPTLGIRGALIDQQCQLHALGQQSPFSWLQLCCSSYPPVPATLSLVLTPWAL